MTTDGGFPVSEFAKLSRTTRATLHHYDKIGLLSPVARGRNKYRYYSSGQLGTVNVIRTLLDSGMPLEEIRELKERRTPEVTLDMIVRQLELMDEKMADIVSARKLFLTLYKSIHSALNLDEGAITIQFMPEEAIMLGEVNDYSGGRNDYDALRSFYKDMGNRYLDVNLDYPVWGIFPEHRIKRGDWILPERYYFYNPAGRDKRPAAHYAVGYARGGYGQNGGLYRRMLEYIEKNGFEICGDAYEEYPMNEICIADDENYLMRVLITVREKTT